MRTVVTLLALLAMVVAVAAPEDVRLRYRMTWGGIDIAEVVDTLRFAADGSYRIDSEAQPTGLAKVLNQPAVNRSSTGQVAEDGSLLMESYVEARGERVRRVTYDRVAGVVEWLDDKGQAGSAQPQGMVLDHLTQVYMPYTTGQLVTAGVGEIADGRRLYEFRFARDAESVTVTGALGELAAWRYARIDYSDAKDRLVWHAPDLRNLPVKVKLVNGANVIEFFLLEIEFDLPPAN